MGLGNVGCHLRKLVIILFIVAFSIPIANVMFITASVTLHTIFEIADAFFNMFTANTVLGMFVTAIAGVSTVVIPDMAGNTASIMITVQHKESLMVKASRHPVILGVTLGAIAVNLLV
jgi:hypothetical protein